MDRVSGLRPMFALANDDENLYVALRGRDQPKDWYEYYAGKHGEKARQYGFNTQNSPSVRLFINDYQAVPNCYGGIWESRRSVKEYQTMWDGTSERRSEIALDWKKLGLDPSRSPFMRIALTRYMRNVWHRLTGTWYLCYESRDKGGNRRTARPNERGWLILGK